MSWVDSAKGLSIILVVAMYSAYNTGEHTGEVGLLHYLVGFATPFRMPEFFLISGLFLSQVIARPWRRYADRRVIHYFYFYALWAFIMIALKVGLYSGSPVGMLRALAIAVVEPYGVLWFIYMLAVFSIAAKSLWQLRVPHWVTIPVAAGLQMAHIDAPSYVMTQFAAYFVFFYVGYAAAPVVYRVVAWAESHIALSIAGLLLWALCNGLLVFSPGYSIMPVETRMGFAALPPLHLLLAIVGALALCVLGALLSKLSFMNWLRWLGEHSLVVYVAFTLPMSIFGGLAMWSDLLTDTGPLSFAVLIVATASPVALYLIVQRLGFDVFLFERPRWAHIDEDRPLIGAPAWASARAAHNATLASSRPPIVCRYPVPAAHSRCGMS
ncbi:MAG TPA: acyltransferase family protein [Pseudolabrys sp.]